MTTENQGLSTLSQNTAVIAQVKKLAETTNKVLAISTRAANPENQGLMTMKTMDDSKLAVIQERMTEIDRATHSFGKTNSQTTSRFMTLTMLNEGPYHMLSQCLAQIEKKRGALKENTFKIQRDTLALRKLESLRDYQVRQLEALQQELTSANVDGAVVTRPAYEIEFELANLQLDLEETNIGITEKVANLSDTTDYYEAALKEIAIYQESYEEIRIGNNIPKEWDEIDYEMAEVKAHVKTAFRLVLRDIEMSGRLNCATMEYLEQYGINPLTAKELAVQYYNQNIQMMQGFPDAQGNPTQQPGMPNIHALNNFLDEVTEIFKDSYKDAMAVRGMSTHISPWVAYTNEGRDTLRLQATGNSPANDGTADSSAAQ